jgi:hypothetical protein
MRSKFGRVWLTSGKRPGKICRPGKERLPAGTFARALTFDKTFQPQ